MEKFLVLFVLGGIGFVIFCIYFIFKQLEFVLVSVNLYKKMIERQETMIKVLKDIRGTGDFRDDVVSSENMQKNLSRITPSKELLMHGGPGHHWGDNYNTHNVVKKCPECKGVFHGREFSLCGRCECELLSQ